MCQRSGSRLTPLRVTAVLLFTYLVNGTQAIASAPHIFGSARAKPHGLGTFELCRTSIGPFMRAHSGRRPAGSILCNGQLALRGGMASHAARFGEDMLQRRGEDGARGRMMDEGFGSDSEVEVPEWLDTAVKLQQERKAGQRGEEEEYLDALRSSSEEEPSSSEAPPDARAEGEMEESSEWDSAREREADEQEARLDRMMEEITHVKSTLEEHALRCRACAERNAALEREGAKGERDEAELLAELQRADGLPADHGEAELERLRAQRQRLRDAEAPTNATGQPGADGAAAGAGGKGAGRPWAEIPSAGFPDIHSAAQARAALPALPPAPLARARVRASEPADGPASEPADGPASEPADGPAAGPGDGRGPRAAVASRGGPPLDGPARSTRLGASGPSPFPYRAPTVASPSATFPPRAWPVPADGGLEGRQVRGDGAATVLDGAWTIGTGGVGGFSDLCARWGPQERTEFNDVPFMLTVDVVSAAFAFERCVLASIGGSGARPPPPPPPLVLSGHAAFPPWGKRRRKARAGGGGALPCYSLRRAGRRGSAGRGGLSGRGASELPGGGGALPTVAPTHVPTVHSLC